MKSGGEQASTSCHSAGPLNSKVLINLNPQNLPKNLFSALPSLLFPALPSLPFSSPPVGMLQEVASVWSELVNLLTFVVVKKKKSAATTPG